MAYSAGVASRAEAWIETLVSLGALMRDLRLHFLSRDIPIALAAVAFGDADWTFGTT